MDDYRVKGVSADMTEDAFLQVLRAAKSPVSDWEAAEVYKACVLRQLSPAFLLAMFKHESSMGTKGWAVKTKSWGNTRPPAYGVNYNEVVSQDTPDRGRYLSLYDDWRDGGRSTVLRLFQHKPYMSKNTVREIIPIWAPSTDGNNVETYIAKVLADIERWAKPQGGTVIPKPAVDTTHRSPNQGGYAGTRRVDAIVNHITDGTNSLGWLMNPASDASSNYLIRRDGYIYELVDPRNDPWTNGKQNKPDISHPLVAKWQKEGANPNQRTVTIEHECTRAQRITRAQFDATVRLQAWLCQEFRLTPDAVHIMGHNSIDSVDRKYCPGFNHNEWVSILGGIKALVNPPTPAPATPEGWLNIGDEDRFKWKDAEGVITYRKARWFNAKKNKWYETEWDHQSGYSPAVEVG